MDLVTLLLVIEVSPRNFYWFCRFVIMCVFYPDYNVTCDPDNSIIQENVI